MKSLSGTETFSRLFDLSNEGIWILTPDFNSILTNERLNELFLFQKQSKLPASIIETIPPDKNEEFYRILKNAFREETQPIQLKINLNQGLHKWFEIRFAFVNELEPSGNLILFFNDISESRKAQKEQEANFSMYFSLFEDSPIPIWEEDFSVLKKEIDLLKVNGKIDFQEYFDQHPDEIDRLSSLIIINKINRAVVELNEAKSKKDVLANLHNLRSDDFIKYLAYQLNAIANNENSCEFDAVLKTTKGNVRHVLFKWTVVKGFEKNYGKVYLTTTDLTQRIIEENIALAQSNRDKEILLREIHHRVKNNFQIISSLIRLQSELTQKLPMEEVFQILLNRIYSMATVHELLYRSEKLEAIPLQDYLIHLINLMIETLNVSTKIDVEIHAETVNIPLDQASPFGLIINEIITNSIKHGFDGLTEGKLYLTAKKSDKNWMAIEIGDNGKGMKQTPSSEDTLGLSLVDSLVQQLNGKIKLLSKSPGTHYLITFPI